MRFVPSRGRALFLLHELRVQAVLASRSASSTGSSEIRGVGSCVCFWNRLDLFNAGSGGSGGAHYYCAAMLKEFVSASSLS